MKEENKSEKQEKALMDSQSAVFQHAIRRCRGDGDAHCWVVLASDFFIWIQLPDASSCRASSHPRPAALPCVSLQQREVAAASLSLLHPTNRPHRPHPGASAAQVPAPFPPLPAEMCHRRLMQLFSLSVPDR